MDVPNQDLIEIRPIHPIEEEQARDLVLEGLGERWGWIDPRVNPDLDRIGETFRDGVFLVALREGRVIGTGGLLPEEGDTCRIVRMSVDRQQRRQGVGSAILERLVNEARMRGFKRILLETTAAWTDAVEFYQNRGFNPLGIHAGNQYFDKVITSN